MSIATEATRRQPTLTKDYHHFIPAPPSVVTLEPPGDALPVCNIKRGAPADGS